MISTNTTTVRQFHLQSLEMIKSGLCEVQRAQPHPGTNGDGGGEMSDWTIAQYPNPPSYCSWFLGVCSVTISHQTKPPDTTKTTKILQLIEEPSCGASLPPWYPEQSQCEVGGVRCEVVVSI